MNACDALGLQRGTVLGSALLVERLGAVGAYLAQIPPRREGVRRATGLGEERRDGHLGAAGRMGYQPAAGQRRVVEVRGQHDKVHTALDCFSQHVYWHAKSRSSSVPVPGAARSCRTSSR